MDHRTRPSRQEDRMTVPTVFNLSALRSAHRGSSEIRARPADAEPAEGAVASSPPQSVLPLAMVFLRLGLTSVGGRSASYVQDELVHRKHWLPIQDYLECFTLARILPGSTGLSVAALTAQRLQGSKASVACVVPYVLPGALLALLLSMFMLGAERPLWVEGALRGCAAGGLALVLSTSLQTVRSAKLNRLGAVLVGLTFLAYGPMGIELIPILIGFGVVSIFIHRPRRIQA
jgi:chromate transporter